MYWKSSRSNQQLNTHTHTCSSWQRSVYFSILSSFFWPCYHCGYLLSLFCWYNMSDISTYIWYTHTHTHTHTKAEGGKKNQWRLFTYVHCPLDWSPYSHFWDSNVTSSRETFLSITIPKAELTTPLSVFKALSTWFSHEHVCVVSRFSRVQLFVTPWTVTHQAPLTMGILQARILEWVAMPSSRASS